MLRVTFNELLSYLKHPWPAPKRIPDKIWQKLSCLWIIGLLPAVFFSLITDRLIASGLLPDLGQAVFDRQSPSFILFGAIVAAPVIEEVLFRMQLRSFGYGYFFMIAFLTIVLSNFAGTRLALITGSALLLIMYSYHRAYLSKSVSREYMVWKKWFPLQFYVTAVFFAVVHIYNYDYGDDHFNIALVYTLPQFISGLILGYVRMRYGLRYAILLHAVHNIIPGILLVYH